MSHLIFLFSNSQFSLSTRRANHSSKTKSVAKNEEQSHCTIAIAPVHCGQKLHIDNVFKDSELSSIIFNSLDSGLISCYLIFF